MTHAITPTPAEVRDALEVAAMGGDLARLAAVCRDQAAQHPEPGRSRLERAAAALAFAAALVPPGHADAEPEIS